MVKVLRTKVSEDSIYKYSVIQFADKYAIFKSQKNQSILPEADFGERIKEFSNATGAMQYFEKI